jgi:hypothetical protein
VKRTLWSLLFCAVTGGVLFFSLKQPVREPAAIHAAGSAVTLLCAGPATGEYVFSFSGRPGKLMTVFGDDGAGQIAGVVDLNFRGRGDDAEFDGPVNVTGTLSTDGKSYLLGGFARGERLQLKLARGGGGTLERTRMVGLRTEQKFIYYSNCQDFYSSEF